MTTGERGNFNAGDEPTVLACLGVRPLGPPPTTDEVDVGGDAVLIRLEGGAHHGEETIMPATCVQWQCGQCGETYG